MPVQPLDRTAVIQIQSGVTDSELEAGLPHLEVIQDPDEAFAFDPSVLLDDVQAIWKGRREINVPFNVSFVPWWSEQKAPQNFSCTLEKSFPDQDTPYWMSERLLGTDLYVSQTAICHPTDYDQSFTYQFQIGKVDADPNVVMGFDVGTFVYSSRTTHPMEP